MPAPDDLLTIEVSLDEEGQVTVAVTGELDHFTSPTLIDRTQPWLRPGILALVLDLSRVRFLDSGGLSGLISVWQHATCLGISVALIVRDHLVAMAISIAGLDRHMNVTTGPDQPAV